MNPLAIAKENVVKNARIPAEVIADADAVTAHFADALLAEYTEAKARGRDKVVFIVPVGPVGQFDVVARRCNENAISLKDLVVINMDEYLTDDGKAFIATDDALSFRRHMDDHFYNLLDPALAPPEDQRIFPDPNDIESVARAIERFGGVDVCFGGVGITGHVAFNDPPEPNVEMTKEAFAALPTRVLALSRETLLINSITTSRGNVDRIPRYAVTVGMKEILAARKVRIYMNRFWQSAIVRKILHGPITPKVPASLLQEHPDVRFVITEEVTEMAEPVLR